MKFNYIFGVAILAVTIVIFAGCGTTQSCRVNYDYYTSDTRGPLYYISGKEAWRSPSAGYNIGTRNTHVLQNAAQLTLDEGYKYFAFHKPNGVSNTNGGLMNTAEEFIKNCVPSSANPFEIGQGRCGWKGQGAVEEALIVVFKEKPHNMLVYDSREVINYLKNHKLFRDDGIEEKINTKCKITGKNLQ